MFVAFHFFVFQGRFFVQVWSFSTFEKASVISFIILFFCSNLVCFDAGNSLRHRIFHSEKEGNSNQR